MKNDANNEITKCNDDKTDYFGFFVISQTLLEYKPVRRTLEFLSIKQSTETSIQCYLKELTYRYSNSTLTVTDVGPFRSTTDKWIAPNGTEYYRLF